MPVERRSYDVEKARRRDIFFNIMCGGLSHVWERDSNSNWLKLPAESYAGVESSLPK